MNSAIVWHYLKGVCSVLGDADKGGRLELRAIYVSKIPIPPASPADKARIETLDQHCLNAQGQAVAPYEAEIEAIVARLYGLTDAELAIIRGT